MYINFKVLSKAGLCLEMLGVLLAIKQKGTKEYIENFCIDEHDFKQSADALEKIEMIRALKTKPGQYELTKKGTSLLNFLSMADVTPESKASYVRIMELYQGIGRADRIGNKSRGLKYYSTFLAETGYTPEFVEEVVETYLNEEDHKFIKTLDKLVFEPQSVYSTRFKLDESKLNILCKCQ